MSAQGSFDLRRGQHPHSACTMTCPPCPLTLYSLPLHTPLLSRGKLAALSPCP